METVFCALLLGVGSWMLGVFVFCALLLGV